MSAAEPGRFGPRMRSSPEFDLIEAIAERLEATTVPARGRIAIGVGDDAAVTVPGGATATTIDAVVDGVHFHSRWCPPEAVGRKALGAALSDLAAMGAAPGEAYVWLGLPEELGTGPVLELCDGIAALALETGTAVLGGDLTRAPALSVSVTAVGHAASADRLVGRAGAESGDVLCVTGELGGAAAGLILLEQPERGGDLDAAAREAAIGRQLEPVSRLAEGRALAGAGARAMIDVSDGLGADAEHLAAASGLGIEVDLSEVPVAPGVAEVAAAAGREPADLLSGGGEDYELLAAVPPERLAACTEAVTGCGGGLSAIGRFAEGEGVRLRLPGGRSLPATGHDHLRPGG